MAFSYKDKFQLTKEENVFIAKRNIIDSIYTESRLEGIAVTFPETKAIYEGANVAHLSVEDVVKINNLKHAWNFILDTVDYPLDLRYVRQLSQEVGSGIVPRAGELRTTGVRIGGTNWVPDIPDYEEVESRIAEIMNADVTTTERALTLMLELMRGQIFYDGNKRVAQLAANQIMIQNGAGIINIPVAQHELFYHMLVEYYETNDAQLIKDLLYRTSIEGIEFPKEVRQPEINREDFYSYRTKDKESQPPFQNANVDANNNEKKDIKTADIEIEK